MPSYVFANPEYLIILVLIIPIIIWYIFKQKKSVPTIQLSTLQGFGEKKISFRNICFNWYIML